MKYRLAISAILLMASIPMLGQMASAHASSGTAKPASLFAAQAPVASGKPVARVNGTVLTDRDLLREMYTIFPYARQHNGSFPQELEPQIRQGALKMIVFEELVYQDALKRGVTVSSAKLDKAVIAFRKQFKNPDDYKNFVKTEGGGSEQTLRAKIRRSLMIDQVLQQDVQSKAVVTLAQAKSYYDKNPSQFQMTESFAIQTITFLPPDKATPAQLKDLRKRAEDGLKQAKATKDYETFGVLAEKISEDDFRVMMGDHHAVERAKLPPEVVKVLLTMQPGQVSDLIQFEGVYTVIRLNAHIPAGEKTFDQVKDSLQKSMQQQKQEQLRASLDKKLRAGAKVEEL
jgi:parvulin-like peptidyl-prolyl isomerase